MKSIRWGFILLGGFLAEFAIIVIVIPLSLIAGRESLLYSAPLASLVVTFFFGLWVARKTIPRLRILHGALVGIVAMLIYMGMSVGQPQPVAYLVAHVLKVLGGAGGGFVAAKRDRVNIAGEGPA